jgi:hypothetical protein
MSNKELIAETRLKAIKAATALDELCREYKVPFGSRYRLVATTVLAVDALADALEACDDERERYRIALERIATEHTNYGQVSGQYGIGVAADSKRSR